MEQEIQNIYKQYKYPGINKLYLLLKKRYSHEQIKNAIAPETSYQMHNKPSKPIRSSVVAFKQNQIWMCDLLDMSNYYRTNQGYRWILLITDVFSRKAYAVATKNKNADTILEAFQSVVKSVGETPRQLITDNGSEFTNRNFQDYIEKSNVFHFMSEPGYHPTLGIIDRLSRTIKEKIFKMFTDEDTTDWVSNLEDIIKAYNNSPHLSLKYLAPNDVDEYPDYVRRLNIKKLKKHNFNLNAGDLVRRKLKRATFTKGYKQIWSTNLHTIQEIKGVNALLDSGDVVKLNDLQKVVQPKENPKRPEPEMEYQVKKVEREYSIDRKLKEEGVDQENILAPSEKRVRKKPERFGF